METDLDGARQDQSASDGDLVFGYQIKERNRATKQSHLMTIDKYALEIPAQEIFMAETASDKQQIKTFGRRESLFISDFDDFMPKRNPIVNFPTVQDDWI